MGNSVRHRRVHGFVHLGIRSDRLRVYPTISKTAITPPSDGYRLPHRIPIDRIRRITLPIRGDASYHRLSLAVSVLQSGEAMNNSNSGITYQSTQPFVLESAFVERYVVWRLHGIPGELESSHITMQQNNNQQLSTEAPNNSMSANLPIFQTSEVGVMDINYFLQLDNSSTSLTLSIVWDKFTSNYRNLWKTVPYNRYFINSIFHRYCINAAYTVFLFSLGGYAFAKYQFRGQKILFGILLASMMVPFSGVACASVWADVRYWMAQ